MTEPAHRTDDQGWALRRLREIHDGLRNDLALLRRAVTAAAEADRDVDAAAATLGELSFRRPGWTLRRFCAGFCGAVHGHHATEDRVLFPMLLRARDRAQLVVVAYQTGLVSPGHPVPV